MFVIAGYFRHLKKLEYGYIYPPKHTVILSTFRKIPKRYKKLYLKPQINSLTTMNNQKYLVLGTNCNNFNIRNYVVDFVDARV